MACGSPRPTSSGRNISELSSSSNEDELEDMYIMDTSKPVGDTCCEISTLTTLKDASEMEWPDSPSAYNHALLSQHEDQFDNTGNESELKWPKLPSECNTSNEMGDRRKHKRLASEKSECDSLGTVTESDEAPKVKVR